MVDPYRPIRDSLPNVPAPRGAITYLPRTDLSGVSPRRGYLARVQRKIAGKVTAWRSRLARWIDPYDHDDDRFWD